MVEMWSRLRAAVVLAISLGCASVGPSGTAFADGDALVLGDPESRVFDRLLQTTDVDLTAAADPGRPGPKRFDLLVLDGDQRSGAELRESNAIENFAAADRWVAVLDAGRQDIETLRSFTGFAPNEDSSRLFMFRVGAAQGSPMIEIVDGGAPTVESEDKLPPGEIERTRNFEIQRAADLLATRAGVEDAGGAAARRVTSSSDRTPCGTLSPTPLQGLLHLGWCYTTVGNETPPSGEWDSKPGWVDSIPRPGSQTANWTMSHRFDVFLDNDPKGGSAKGNFDVIYYSLNGEFAPKRSSESFYRMYQGFTSGWNDIFGREVVTERAWWTGRADPSVSPLGTLLTRKDSEPQSGNDSVSFSSSESFSIGFSGTLAKPDGGLGVGASVGWTSEKGRSYSVPSWAVQNQVSGRDAAWSFSSRQPCDISTPNEGKNLKQSCFVDGGVGNHYPAEPNEISRTSLQIKTSARWETSAPIPDGYPPIPISLKVPVRMIDTYCSTSWNGGAGFCPFGIESGYGMRGWTTGPKPVEAKIEADWVNPVPIDSLALSSTSARADNQKNDTVTGTINLKRAAHIPVDVQVIAVGPNTRLAEPFPGVTDGSQVTVRIDPGEKTGKFTVYTNANGLSPGNSSSSLIYAFYAERTDPVQLTVTRPG